MEVTITEKQIKRVAKQWAARTGRRTQRVMLFSIQQNTNNNHVVHLHFIELLPVSCMYGCTLYTPSETRRRSAPSSDVIESERECYIRIGLFKTVHFQCAIKRKSQQHRHFQSNPYGSRYQPMLAHTHIHSHKRARTFTRKACQWLYPCA